MPKSYIHNNTITSTSDSVKYLNSLPKELLDVCGVTQVSPELYLATVYAPDGTKCGAQEIRPAEATRGRRYHWQNGGRVGLFNAPYLYEPAPDGVVFITEGVKDALAFNAMGRFAVATLGTGNLKPLLDTLRHRPPVNALVVAMDNDPADSKQAGQKATARLLKEMSEIPGIRVVPPPACMYGGQKDAADAYMADLPALEAFIEAAVKSVADSLPTSGPVATAEGEAGHEGKSEGGHEAIADPEPEGGADLGADLGADGPADLGAEGEAGHEGKEVSLQGDGQPDTLSLTAYSGALATVAGEAAALAVVRDGELTDPQPVPGAATPVTLACPDELGWTAHLECDKEGKCLGTFTNFELILTNDFTYKGRIHYNALTRDTLISEWRQTPIGVNAAACIPASGCPDTVILHEGQHVLLQKDIYMRYRIDNPAAFERGLSLVAAAQAFNPIHDFLHDCYTQKEAWLQETYGGKNIPPLGALGIDNMLCRYLGAEPTQLTYATSRLHMAAAVARIMKPGVKYDHMLVLWSKQGGIGKTMFVNGLFSPWTQEITLWTGKDAAGALRGQWCANADELNITSKSEASDIKRFITTDTDRYRPPYGRQEVAYPRTCIFMATANHPCALEEAAGNRRFWNVECGLSSPERSVMDLAADRVDLWAEAVHVYKTCYSHGEPLVLPREVEAAAADNQETSREVPLWEQYTRAYTTILVPRDWSEYSPEQRRCFMADQLGYTPMDSGKEHAKGGADPNRPWLGGYTADRAYPFTVDKTGWQVIPNITVVSIVHDLQDAPSMKGVSSSKIGGLLRSLDYLEFRRKGNGRYYINHWQGPEATDGQ